MGYAHQRVSWVLSAVSNEEYGPNRQIEVTAEMRQAGAWELYASGAVPELTGSDEEVVERIFLTMLRLSSQSKTHE